MSSSNRAAMAKTLPHHVIIQSNDNNRYARFDSGNQLLPNALRFEGEYSFGIETRFEVVPATTTTATGFVHIRCLQNNKYWSNSGYWVTATAVKPEEDTSNKNCTLFQPVFLKLNDNNHHVVKLRHANTGNLVRNLRMHNDKNDYNGCLTLGPKLLQPDDDNTDVCTFIDWESVVMLPDVIRIKGDNGNHLRAYADGFMDFQSKADNSSMYDYEVSPTRDGGIRLKNTHFGTYWTDMDSVCFVRLQKADHEDHDTKTIFLPVKFDGNRIRIRSFKNGNFCKRYDASYWSYSNKTCLATTYKYGEQPCHMEIEEPVLARTISNVIYQLTSARIYDERTDALITDDSRNKTLHPQTSEVNLKTTVTNTTNWRTSVSIKQGVKMTGTYGVPKVNSGSLEISREATKSWNQEKTETEIIEVGCVRTVTVPPMSRVKTSLMATRCSYDIPFSYTQRDVLMNGNTRVCTKNDGLFKGESGYNYNYEMDELSL
ncbi:uncharacterized protein LOC113337035 [Papaver somniferum]|uniref:uncharacterized protein LOC113337035 n=1 Tax=Papaver somniferum TaxID=3469 RepID=UPI000E6FE3E7|nr:uncharacterized protein LOC113337035 [Papaver somniferum]